MYLWNPYYVSGTILGYYKYNFDNKTYIFFKKFSGAYVLVKGVEKKVNYEIIQYVSDTHNGNQIKTKLTDRKRFRQE